MKMTSGAAKAITMCAMVVMMSVPAQADWWGEQKEIPLDESIPLSGASNIEISFKVGELRIEHGPSDAIEIEGDIVINSHSRRRVERLIEELQLEIETGETISISLHPSSSISKGYGIDLTVRVPEGIDLDVSLGVGELNAKIVMPASAQFDLGIGELDINFLEETATHVSASVAIGEVKIDGFDVQGSTSRRRHLLGARYFGTIGDSVTADGHNLRADVNIGEVSVEGSLGD